jgi:predicted MFS family arabinose efflux permease
METIDVSPVKKEKIKLTKPELKLALLISLVQFVNVLDFMMVMPMGPDFARALAIPLSDLGLIGGSYTAAAALSGFLGSFFLDRFPRKKTLLVLLAGLALGTAFGGIATNFTTLLLARIFAGLFGGPATSVSFSIIGDEISNQKRGQAMGLVMGSFSLASILGVPFGLECARMFGWRAPFFILTFLITLVIFFTAYKLPRSSRVLQKAATLFEWASFKSLLTRKENWLSYISMGLGMFGGFMIIPNISAYFQENLGFPRNQLGILYFIGGIASLASMQVCGFLVDKFGAFFVTAISSAILCFDIYFGYHEASKLLPPAVLFVLFMLGMSIRGVAISSLATRVPKPQERARFMSFQSAIQHISSSLGAFVSSYFLTVGLDGKLQNMPFVATLSLISILFIPFVVYPLEKKVRRMENA